MTRRRWIYPNDGSPPVEITDQRTPAPRGPLIYGDLPSYQSPIDGRWINGRVARREDLARSGCRPWEGSEQERKEAARRERYDEQRQDRVIEQSIERAFGQVSESTKRALLDN